VIAIHVEPEKGSSILWSSMLKSLISPIQPLGAK